MGASQSIQSNNLGATYAYSKDMYDQNDRRISQVASSSMKNSDFACSHNTREGVSYMDIVEHGLNQEYGSAIRDLVDIASGKEKPVGIDQESNTRNTS